MQKKALNISRIVDRIEKCNQLLSFFPVQKPESLKKRFQLSPPDLQIKNSKFSWEKDTPESHSFLVIGFSAYQKKPKISQTL